MAAYGSAASRTLGPSPARPLPPPRPVRSVSQYSIRPVGGGGTTGGGRDHGGFYRFSRENVRDECRLPMRGPVDVALARVHLQPGRETAVRRLAQQLQSAHQARQQQHRYRVGQARPQVVAAHRVGTFTARSVMLSILLITVAPSRTRPPHARRVYNSITKT